MSDQRWDVGRQPEADLCRVESAPDNNLLPTVRIMVGRQRESNHQRSKGKCFASLGSCRLSSRQCVSIVARNVATSNYQRQIMPLLFRACELNRFVPGDRFDLFERAIVACKEH